MFSESILSNFTPFELLVYATVVAMMLRECEGIYHDVCSNLAAEELVRSSQLLVSWREARPFLYVGQCTYAQSLVRDMISAYLRILKHQKGIKDNGQLEALYRLLNEKPPSSDPSSASDAPEAFLL